MEKKIVITAQNISEGGPLTILNSLMNILIEDKNNNHFTVFVYKKKLLNQKKFSRKINIIEIPYYRKNLFKRLYYELFFFKNFSKIIKPDVWISLHDTIPNIIAKKKIVYFHTPIGFYNMSLKDIYFEPVNFLRSIYYKIIYKLKRYEDITMIVQQNWIKKILNKKFSFKKIIVNRPYNQIKHNKKIINNKEIVFFYPSLPRFQKNFEIIVKSCNFLKKYKFKILLTFSKNENRYSKYIYKLSKKIPQIFFIGRKSHKEVLNLYQKTDCLIFSSKLETWGLPLSEASQYSIPILAPNLPYARETLLGYKNKYLYEYNSNSLLKKMKFILKNKKLLKKNINTKNLKDNKNWKKLWYEIIN